MKKVIVSAFMLVSVATTMYAQDVKTTAPVAAAVTIAPQDENKTKVDPATLPDAVKATLASDQYKGWTVSNAWATKADPVSFILELKKDDKITTLSIDKDGKVLGSKIGA